MREDRGNEVGRKGQLKVELTLSPRLHALAMYDSTSIEARVYVNGSPRKIPATIQGKLRLNGS